MAGRHQSHRRWKGVRPMRSFLSDVAPTRCCFSLIACIALLSLSSGCQGFGRNVNPYAAYGSPRIAAPGTGSYAVSGQPANAGATTNATNTNTTGATGTPAQPASNSDPYYAPSTNTQLQVTPTSLPSNNGFTPGGMPTRSINSTPTSTEGQWRPSPPSGQSNRGTPIGSGVATQAASTQNTGSFHQDNLPGASVPATASAIPTQLPTDPIGTIRQSGFQTTTPTTGESQLGPMRVNDATQNRAPQQFTPPPNARPIQSVSPSSIGQQGYVPTIGNGLSGNGQHIAAIASTMPNTLQTVPQDTMSGGGSTYATSGGWSSRSGN